MASSENDEVRKMFKDLCISDLLIEACETSGCKKNPSKIQAEAIPHALALEGKDLTGLSQADSSKTDDAIAHPIINVLLDAPQAFFASVLFPTRELAIQFAEQLEALWSSLGGLKCAVLVGGIDIMQQTTISLAKRPRIVVGSPGRLMDHLSNTKCFSTLKYLDLDEADTLLDDDFEKTIDEILKAIPNSYLFSATMTKKDLDEADRLLDDDFEKTIDETLKAKMNSHLFSATMTQKACLRNPVKIEAASKYSTVDTLVQQCCLIPAKHKDCYLVFILTEKPHTTSMVFTRTCETTRILALLLHNLGLRAIPISSQMSQAKRLGALNKFKAGECNILICTNVASRGLDIPFVDMVINYDIPTNSKDYIHRVGRTAARALRSGVAISLVNQYEVERYYQIEKLAGKESLLFKPQREEVLLLLERVSVAKRLSLMKLKVSGGRRKNKGGEDRAKEVDRYLTSKTKKSSNSKKTKKNQ